jgi:hypothetical protein
MRLFNKLNNPSLAKSVVGRAVILLGAEIRRPLNFPLMIRTFYRDKRLMTFNGYISLQHYPELRFVFEIK